MRLRRSRHRRRWFLTLIFLVVLAVIASLAGEDDPENGHQPAPDQQSAPSNQTGSAEDPPVSRADEIKAEVQSTLDKKSYQSARLTELRVNQNMGSDSPEASYILLISLDFTVKNTRTTGNSVMRLQSDDLAATLAGQLEDVDELAIFWRDEYNSRTVKYAYEFRDGGAFVTDIMGE